MNESGHAELRLTVPLGADGTADAIASVAGTGSDGEALVLETASGSLLFRSTALGDGPGIEVAASDRRNGALYPRALVATSDGWWIAAIASWQTEHYGSEPPAAWFVHLGADGHVLGRAVVRLADPYPDYAGITDVRLDGSTLRASVHALREPHVWRDVAVVEAPACVESTSRCGARQWARHEGTAAITDDSGPQVTPSAVASVRDACSDRRGSAAWFGAISSTTLALRDAEGRERWSAPGSWLGCAVATLPDAIVLAGIEVIGGSSAGPITDVVLHVLSTDGRTLLGRHPLPTARGAVQVLADPRGAWLVWWSGAWDRYVWRLDRAGRPGLPPRLLASLYDFPATRLVMTELGPSLVWSSQWEEGVVPICSVADPSEL